MILAMPRAQPPSPKPQATPGEAMAHSLRPWIGVRFLCAGHYVRVYRNRGGDAYLAACPRCGRTVRFRVGSGGVQERFFEVSC
jgi:hypothetical protein